MHRVFSQDGTVVILLQVVLALLFQHFAVGRLFISLVVVVRILEFVPRVWRRRWGLGLGSAIVVGRRFFAPVVKNILPSLLFGAHKVRMFAAIFVVFFDGAVVIDFEGADVLSFVVAVFGGAVLFLHVAHIVSMS